AGGCAELSGVRVADDPQRLLLQVSQLRRDERLLVARRFRGREAVVVRRGGRPPRRGGGPWDGRGAPFEAPRGGGRLDTPKAASIRGRSRPESSPHARRTGATDGGSPEVHRGPPGGAH